MKSKKFFAWVIAIALLLTLSACTPANGGDETTAAPDETAAAADSTTTEAVLCAIKVTVVHKDGTEKVFTYTTDEEYLGTVLQAEKLIEGNDGPYGLEITVVDGEKAVYNEDKAYWALYENGEYALQGIDTTPVVDGGEYKLEYTPA